MRHHDECELGGKRERQYEGGDLGRARKHRKRASRLHRPRPDSRSLPSFP